MISPINDQNENEDEPLAAWEALLLPSWRWEALEKKEEGLYYGRVKSSLTYHKWEYGYFTQDQLEEAGAYRVDTEINSDEPLFPDGGYEEIVQLYETELDALQNLEYDEIDE